MSNRITDNDSVVLYNSLWESEMPYKATFFKPDFSGVVQS